MPHDLGATGGCPGLPVDVGPAESAGGAFDTTDASGDSDRARGLFDRKTGSSKDGNAYWDSLPEHLKGKLASGESGLLVTTDAGGRPYYIDRFGNWNAPRGSPW